MTRPALLFVMSSPSGTDKSSLARRGAEPAENVAGSVFLTTRPPRAEQQGAWWDRHTGQKAGRTMAAPAAAEEVRSVVIAERRRTSRMEEAAQEILATFEEANP